jgi:hypothetical protein
MEVHRIEADVLAQANVGHRVAPSLCEQPGRRHTEELARSLGIE